MALVDLTDNDEHDEEILSFPHDDFPDVTFEPRNRTLKSLQALRLQLLAAYQPLDRFVNADQAIYKRMKEVMVADFESRVHYCTQGLGLTWLVDPTRQWLAGSAGLKSAERMPAAFVSFAIMFN